METSEKIGPQIGIRRPLALLFSLVWENPESSWSLLAPGFCNKEWERPRTAFGWDSGDPGPDPRKARPHPPPQSWNQAFAPAPGYGLRLEQLQTLW